MLPEPPPFPPGVGVGVGVGGVGVGSSSESSFVPPRTAYALSPSSEATINPFTFSLDVRLLPSPIPALPETVETFQSTLFAAALSSLISMYLSPCLSLSESCPLLPAAIFFWLWSSPIKNTAKLAFGSPSALLVSDRVIGAVSIPI